MNSAIALTLGQDGLTTGLIYALLSLSILLVFIVSRVIWIPAGDFVVYGALTLATLQEGRIPGSAWMSLGIGIIVALLETWRAWRQSRWQGWWGWMGIALALPTAAVALTFMLAARQPPLVVQAALALLIVVPMGPLLYRVAFRPLAGSSILNLLFVAVAVHFVLFGMGLLFFGPEAFKARAFVEGKSMIAELQISNQLLLVLGASTAIMTALWYFFERTLWGKALRAVAVNGLGARLVGIRTEAAGAMAFSIAALIGALSGVLISPVTALYYDSGFLVGFNGFVGAVVGGFASFPMAVIGSLLVGLLQSFSGFYVSAYKEAIVLAMIVPVLLWRTVMEARAGHTEEVE